MKTVKQNNTKIMIKTGLNHLWKKNKFLKGKTSSKRSRGKSVNLIFSSKDQLMTKYGQR